MIHLLGSVKDNSTLERHAFRLIGREPRTFQCRVEVSSADLRVRNVPDGVE